MESSIVQFTKANDFQYQKISHHGRLLASYRSGSPGVTGQFLPRGVAEATVVALDACMGCKIDSYIKWTSDRMVRVLDCCAEDQCLESNPRASLDASSQSTQQETGAWRQHWEDRWQRKDLATKPHYADDPG